MDSTSALLTIGTNRRGRLEIMVSIIALAQNGRSIANLRNKANLSFTLTKRYLVELAMLGFIEVKNIDGRTVYISSERGNEFLRQYDLLRKFF